MAAKQGGARAPWPPLKSTTVILTMNNLSFDGENYLQIHGTAMGTRMALSYANLFMGHLEEDILEGRAERPTVWWRFIDDMLMIWPHGEGRLEDFFIKSTSCTPQ